MKTKDPAETRTQLHSKVNKKFNKVSKLQILKQIHKPRKSTLKANNHSPKTQSENIQPT